MNWYKIDYNRLVRLLLPTMLRKPIIQSFLDAMVTPVKTLYNAFNSYRKEADYKLNHNSQICYLQAVLNDSFDSDNRRIYIGDAPIEEWSRFLWKESEDRPIMLPKNDETSDAFMLQSERFIGANSLDFIVYAPNALNLNKNDLIKMNALIRYYKLAGKRYEIQTI